MAEETNVGFDQAFACIPNVAQSSGPLLELHDSTNLPSDSPPSDSSDEKALLEWVQSLTKSGVNSLEELQNGALYCQLVDAYSLEELPIQKVNFGAIYEWDCLANYRVLEEALDILGLHRVIEKRSMMKSVKLHVQFLKWLKENLSGLEAVPGYEPVERRRCSKSGDVDKLPVRTCATEPLAPSSDFGGRVLRASTTRPSHPTVKAAAPYRSGSTTTAFVLKTGQQSYAPKSYHPPKRSGKALPAESSEESHDEDLDPAHAGSELSAPPSEASEHDVSAEPSVEFIGDGAERAPVDGGFAPRAAADGETRALADVVAEAAAATVEPKAGDRPHGRSASESGSGGPSSVASGSTADDGLHYSEAPESLFRQRSIDSLAGSETDCSGPFVKVDGTRPKGRGMLDSMWGALANIAPELSRLLLRAKSAVLDLAVEAQLLKIQADETQPAAVRAHVTAVLDGAKWRTKQVE